MSINAALITAAGASIRMGPGEKKEYRLIDGRPVLAASIAAFKETGLFSVIVLTVPHGHIDRVRALLHSSFPSDEFFLVEGGMTRKDSVYNGLQLLAHLGQIDYVLIHDGARPWITPGLIQTVLDGARAYGAAVPAIDVCDALIETDDDGWIKRHLSKKNLCAVQTPQGFKFIDIWEAHRTIRSSEITFYDDAQVLMHSGKRVIALSGDPANRKITFPCDLGGRG